MQNRSMKAALCFALLVLATRFKYAFQTVLEGRPYFLDADCYTRMMRVKCLLADGQVFRGFHPWENAPDGITTHATALLDLLIALPALALRLVLENGLDWAGWVVPPFLAAWGALLLFQWTAEPCLKLGWIRWPILLTYALHPLVLWANSVGRPDHQALLIPLLSCAFVLDLLRAREDRWVWMSGLCWGTALWVSLYEPLILLLPSVLLTVIFLRSQSLRWIGAIALVAVPAWLLEGWRWSGGLHVWQNPLTPHWLAMIGELKSPPWGYWLPFSLLIPALLAGLWWNRKSLRSIWKGRNYSSTYIVLICLVLIGLSLWQQRWMALLPFPLTYGCFTAIQGIQSSAWRNGAIALHLIPLCLWNLMELPYLQPPREWAQTRAVARQIRGGGTILAPWWLSPALLYYSGNPIVASSSHQSLPGIIDSARFFASRDFVEADEILRNHRVDWVAVYRPIRSFENARQILQGPGADPTIEEKDFYEYVVLRLWDFKMVPKRYQLVFVSEDWRLYRYSPIPSAGGD
jgi:hypothetical protein